MKHRLSLSIGYSEIRSKVRLQGPHFILLHGIHMQYSSTGNPDIVPEKEKKESARHHTGFNVNSGIGKQTYRISLLPGFC